MTRPTTLPIFSVDSIARRPIDSAYDAITIEGESFDKAFSSGKEVAACLGYAMEIGWREVLEDMLRLRLAILTPQRANDLTT